MAGDSPTLIALERRMAALEAEGQIRSVVARYMEMCDDLGPHTDLAELGRLFTNDAVWAGSGKAYDQAFGEHVGNAAIVAFLGHYCQPPHFKSNVHFLTSEALHVDGTQAHGTWVMLQTPTFANDESFVLAARLHIAFRIEQGAWRMARFATANLFGRPVSATWRGSVAIPIPGGPIPGAETSHPPEPASI